MKTPQRLIIFGGEVDNWMWPRHTCDFSFLRANVTKDGLSAEFSPENVLYPPKSVIKISLDGVKDGDFTFIMGYPGRTFRNATLAEVRFDRGSLARRVEQFKELIAFFEKAGKLAPDANGTIRFVCLKSSKRLTGRATSAAIEMPDSTISPAIFST